MGVRSTPVQALLAKRIVQLMTSVQELKRVLIANRGEIAIRIAKSAASLNMDSVGVFSPIDRDAVHTRFTTDAVEIGSGNQTIEPYLSSDEIIRVAKATQCDYIHPGYGFLSESFDLASKCESAGVQFVGPSSSALRLFGDKIAARDLANSLGIPTISGSMVAVDTVDDALSASNEIGYPVMLKGCRWRWWQGNAQSRNRQAHGRCL